MIHYMRLNHGPFMLIKSKQKSIEMRLNDEKRQKLKVGDQVEFTDKSTNEKIVVQVVNLHRFSSFQELYNNFDKLKLGYQSDDVANPEDMEQYYSKDEIKKYGVVSIEINLLHELGEHKFL